MPRQRISHDWIARVYAATAQDPKMPADALADLLAAQARNEGRDDFPSARTVARRQAEFRNLTAVEQEDYRLYFFPETHERASHDLPWESAAACLDLTEHLAERFGRRPTVRLAKWFWRVTMARPGLVTENRYFAARWLAIWEIFEPEHGTLDRRRLERLLRGGQVDVNDFGVLLPKGDTGAVLEILQEIQYGAEEEAR